MNEQPEGPTKSQIDEFIATLHISIISNMNKQESTTADAGRWLDAIDFRRASELDTYRNILLHIYTIYL